MTPTAKHVLRELQQLASTNSTGKNYTAECRRFHALCDNYPIALPEFNAWNDQRKASRNDKQED